MRNLDPDFFQSIVKFLRRDTKKFSFNELIQKSEGSSILIEHALKELEKGCIEIPEGECECPISYDPIDLSLDRKNPNSARVLRTDLTVATGERKQKLFNFIQVYTHSCLQDCLNFELPSPLTRSPFDEDHIACLKDLQNEYEIFKNLLRCILALDSISSQLKLQLEKFSSNEAMIKSIKVATRDIEEDKNDIMNNFVLRHEDCTDVSLNLDRSKNELESAHKNLNKGDFFSLEIFLRKAIQTDKHDSILLYHSRILNKESLIPVSAEEIQQACDFFIECPSMLNQFIRNRALDKIPFELENAFYLYLSQPLPVEEPRRTESASGYMRSTLKSMAKRLNLVNVPAAEKMEAVSGKILLLNWIAKNLNLLELPMERPNYNFKALKIIEDYIRTKIDRCEQHFRVLNKESIIPVHTEEIQRACDFFIQSPSELIQVIRNRESNTEIPVKLKEEFYSYLCRALPAEDSRCYESACNYMCILDLIANNSKLLVSPNENLYQVALNVNNLSTYIDERAATSARRTLKDIFWEIIKEKSSISGKENFDGECGFKELQGIQCFESMDSSLLCMAAYEGNDQAANIILNSLSKEKRQTSIDKVRSGKTSLETAIDGSNWSVVELLIKNNATIRAKDFKAILNTPILMSLDATIWINHLSEKNIDQIKLQIGPEDFKKILDNNNCLEKAVSAKNFKLVSKILNCNPIIIEPTFRTILKRCINTNNDLMLQILSYLLEKQDCLKLFCDLLMCSSLESDDASLRKECLFFLIINPSALKSVLTYLGKYKDQSYINSLLHEAPVGFSEKNTMLSVAMISCPESAKVLLKAITTDKKRAELINKEIIKGKTAIDFCKDPQSLRHLLHYRSMIECPIKMSGERFNKLVTNNYIRSKDYREIIGYCLQCRISDLSTVSIERCIKNEIPIPDKVIKSFLDLINDKQDRKQLKEHRNFLTKYPSILMQAIGLGLDINNESHVWFSSAVESGNIESLKIIVESLVNKDEIKSFINNPIAGGKTMLDQAVSATKYDLAEYLLSFKPTINASQFEALLRHYERKRGPNDGISEAFKEFITKSLLCEFVSITPYSIGGLNRLLTEIPEKLIEVFIRPLVGQHDPTIDIDRREIISTLILDHRLLQTAINLHGNKISQPLLLKESPCDADDTWLSFACFNRAKESVKIILSNILDIKLRQELLNQKTHEGKTALEWALCKTERQINWEIISILLDYNPEINVESFSTILEEGTDDDIIKKCLKTDSGKKLATQFLTKAQNKTYSARWFRSVSPPHRKICKKITNLTSAGNMPSSIINQSL